MVGQPTPSALEMNKIGWPDFGFEGSFDTLTFIILISDCVLGIISILNRDIIQLDRIFHITDSLSPPDRCKYIAFINCHGRYHGQFKP